MDVDNDAPVQTPPRVHQYHARCPYCDWRGQGREVVTEVRGGIEFWRCPKCEQQGVWFFRRGYEVTT